MYLYRYNMYMKPNLDALLEARQALLDQMQSVDRLRRGSLSKQFFKSDPAGPATRGPYYVLQCFFRGKKCSQRIPQDQAARVQQDVDNFRHFQTMADEFVSLSDQITRLRDESATEKKTPAAGGQSRTVSGKHGLPPHRASKPGPARGP